VITVQGLAKRHGELPVLEGIDLEVAEGAVEAIIGPSGGGKSTLLRCLNGLERFEAGEVRIGALRLTPHTSPRRDAALLRQVRRQLGFVFQQFQLFPHLSVLGNLVEAPMHVLGLSRDEAEARARALLERVSLSSKADARPHQLSGGQQQRVAIARTLAMQPRAILFDEPTSSLDPAMAADVLALMAELARDGQTMLVVTHSMHFARQVASRVHVVVQGRIVESGPPEAVLEAPQQAATQRFLRQVV